MPEYHLAESEARVAGLIWENEPIASGDVPPPLKDVTLRVLDVGLLQAGASMKGEFENRLRQVIDEVQSSPKPDHAVTIQIDRLSQYDAIWRLVITDDAQIITACVLDRGGPDRVRDRLGRRVYVGECVKAGYRHLAEALDRLAKAMGA